MDKFPSSASSVKLPSSSHRLPTVSASEALQNIKQHGPRAISTGLKQLDTLLGGLNSVGNGIPESSSEGGLARGKVTQVWGPSGSGKTTFAMQTASRVIRDGGAVAWVDTSSRLAKPRFSKILEALRTPDFDHENDHLKRLYTYLAPTVAHLLAITMHAPPSFLPRDTALLVIDGVHTVFDIAYPRHYSNSSASRTEAARWAAGRRYSVLGSFMTALKKLAAINDVAILVTCGCATRIRPGSGYGAVLAPGIGGAEWEAGIANKLVLFGDVQSARPASSQRHDRMTRECTRYIGLQKINSVALGEDGDIGRLLAFKIDDTGLSEINNDPAMTEAAIVNIATSSPVRRRKRRHDEIADSDEDIPRDEYGWLDEDTVAAEGLVDDPQLIEEDEEPQPAAETDEGTPEQDCNGTGDNTEPPAHTRTTTTG